MVNVTCGESAALNFTHHIAVQLEHPQPLPYNQPIPRMPRRARFAVVLPLQRIRVVRAVATTALRRLSANWAWSGSGPHGLVPTRERIGKPGACGKVLKLRRP